MSAISEPLRFMWVILQGKDNILPGTNAKTEVECIQAFLNRMNPIAFPPIAVNGALIGKAPPQEVWESLQQTQELKAIRVQVEINVPYEDVN